MKIEEAKICLLIQVEVKYRLGKDFEATALQLGIEALKRVEANRKEGGSFGVPLLPFESK